MKLQKVNFAAKSLTILAGLSFSSILVAGEPFMLVSEEEYLLQLDQKEVQRKKMKFKTRSIFNTDQNTPLIIINSPSLTSVLYSPIRIEVNFKVSDDANIQVDSLKVLYGWLNLDITDRIKQHAQISYAGISAENVKLPIGEHHITIQIMDTMERSTEKEVSFEILTPEDR